jgi:hypothetical protein
MPHIPTPPTPTMTTQQMIQKLQQISGMVQSIPQTTNNLVVNPNTYQQAILDAVEVKRIALEQAQRVLDEHMKAEQEKRKQTFLTIENIDKIKGHDYSEWLKVIGVKEHENFYEFTLGNKEMSQIETILLHRRQTNDKRYIMEYNHQTLWVSKDRLSTIDGIIECMQDI